MVKIKKIKMGKKGKGVFLEYQERNRQGRWDDKTMNSGDCPVPEFFEAIQFMVPDLIEHCELPEELEKNTVVTQLSISWHGSKNIDDHQALEDAKDDIGVVITGQRQMQHANSPLNLNSPHKMAINENNETHQLTAGCLRRLQKCMIHAEDFLNGKRAQGDLFEGVSPAADTSDLTAMHTSPDDVVATMQEELNKGNLTVDKAREIIKISKDIQGICDKAGVTITITKDGVVSMKKKAGPRKPKAGGSKRPLTGPVIGKNDPRPAA